jgi:hypothetical protein
MIINNFYFMLDSNINSNAKNLDISTFFSKLKTSSEKNTFVELTLNKLNLDKAIVVDNNLYNLNTLLLLNVKLK